MTKIDQIINNLKVKYGEENTVKLCAYMNSIIKANEEINLTSVTDKEEFLDKHIWDSLSCFELPEFSSAKKVLDMGTGAGFPGVPLAIVAPEKEILLVDSLNKKLKVVSDIAEDMGIHNVSVKHVRAEDMGQDIEHREKYDLVVTRAVARLDILVEWCLPLLKTGGSLIAYKGPKADEELSDAETAIRVLGGGEVRLIKTDTRDSTSGHVLVRVRKIGKTPRQFPRKPGIAKKDPIK